MTVPSWVGDYVGLPFEAYGRTKEGVDCWGLARLIWREQLWMALPDYDIDPNDGAGCELAMESELANWRRIPAGGEREFDGISMTGLYGIGIWARKAEMHVGVVVEPGIMIHIDERVGFSCLQRYRERIVGHDVAGFWRHKKLAAS